MVPGAWGPARKANGTQLSPPARPEEEDRGRGSGHRSGGGGGSGGGRGCWLQDLQMHSPTPGLAGCLSPPRLLPLPGEPASKQAGFCVPQDAQERGSCGRGRRGFKSQPGVGKASSDPPPSSLAGSPEGWGRSGDPPPKTVEPHDVAATQVPVVSFFQFLGLTFLVFPSVCLQCSPLSPHPQINFFCSGLIPREVEPASSLFFFTP